MAATLLVMMRLVRKQEGIAIDTGIAVDVVIVVSVGGVVVTMTAFFTRKTKEAHVILVNNQGIEEVSKLCCKC